MKRTEERLWLATAGLAALPILIGPIGDPDLWWHLSAGRWMFEHRAWPRVEWLSYTMAGRPWTDFEWLSQIIFYACYAFAGTVGLWLLKAVLLATAGIILWSLLGDLGEKPADRALGLILWATALLHRAEIRTELFSLCAFALLVRELELRRQKRGSFLFSRPVILLLFFGIWANCHAGFACGLILITVYAAGEAGNGSFLLVSLALGAAGALLNPYGFSAYSVLWHHATGIVNLSRNIVEWQPLRVDRFGHWPAWVLIAFVSFSFGRAFRRGRLRSTFPAVASAVFGVMALLWARFVPYFATLSIPLTLRYCGPPPLPRRAYGAVFAALAAFVVWADRSERIFRRVSHDLFLAPQTTRYLQLHKEFYGRPLYNPWGWGGYFGFWLYPKYRVFQDGRYLFHPLLAEGAKAANSAEGWQSFLDRYGVEIAVVDNLARSVAMPRLYPDGSKRVFQRPIYIQYMPRERWALIHWDARALVFLRRSAFKPEELRGLEYRLAWPGDEQALKDALARGEVDSKLLELERTRHIRELEQLDFGPGA